MQLRELGGSVELAPSDWRCVDIHRFGLEFKPRIWVVINITHYRILGGGVQISEENIVGFRLPFLPGNQVGMSLSFTIHILYDGKSTIRILPVRL